MYYDYDVQRSTEVFSVVVSHSYGCVKCAILLRPFTTAEVVMWLMIKLKFSRNMYNEWHLLILIIWNKKASQSVFSLIELSTKIDSSKKKRFSLTNHLCTNKAHSLKTPHMIASIMKDLTWTTSGLILQANHSHHSAKSFCYNNRHTIWRVIPNNFCGSKWDETFESSTQQIFPINTFALINKLPPLSAITTTLTAYTLC